MSRFTTCSIVLDQSLTCALAPPCPGSENASDAAPRAAEFITTRETKLTADGTIALPPREANSSPGSQVLAPNGELIGPQGCRESDPSDTKARPQVICMEPLAPVPAANSHTPAAAENVRLNHHGAAEPGEVFGAGRIPARCPRLALVTRVVPGNAAPRGSSLAEPATRQEPGNQ
jgi:hypothetical protein